MNIPCFCRFTIMTLVFILSALSGCSNEKRGKEALVAIAQVFCIDGDRSGNLLRIENAIAEAKDNGADIICLPETPVYGWVNPVAHSVAGEIPGKDSEEFCKLAAKYNVFISAGLSEKEGDKLYDSAILVDNEGNIILKHRKINVLKELMNPPYTPGNIEDITAVDTKFGRIGILICADSFKEDILEQMKAEKPDLLLIPYGWAATEEMWPEHGDELMKTVVNVSIKVGCTVVGTDLVGRLSNGPWTGLTYGGQSICCDSNGSILIKANDRDRQIVVFDIN